MNNGRVHVLKCTKGNLVFQEKTYNSSLPQEQHKNNGEHFRLFLIYSAPPRIV